MACNLLHCAPELLIHLCLGDNTGKGQQRKRLTNHCPTIFARRTKGSSLTRFGPSLLLGKEPQQGQDERVRVIGEEETLPRTQSRHYESQPSETESETLGPSKPRTHVSLECEAMHAVDSTPPKHSKTGGSNTPKRNWEEHKHPVCC